MIILTNPMYAYNGIMVRLQVSKMEIVQENKLANQMLGVTIREFFL